MLTTETDDHKNSNINALPGILESGAYELEELDIDPNATDDNRPRRFSVSAESTDEKKIDKFIKKVYPKSNEAMRRIKNSVKNVFLFQGLDKEQSKLLVDAMFEKRVKKGEEIISQGDQGDYFYVVETGIYEVWKSQQIYKQPTETEATSENKTQHRRSSSSKHFEWSAPTRVYIYNNEGSFGELALMYHSPRAATVKAISLGILWAVDRKTFRHIIVTSTARKRNKYEKFLAQVPLFLNAREQLRSGVVDVLETKAYRAGELVVTRGHNADLFYIIQTGTAVVTLDGSKSAVRELRPGDYFGERALLLNDLRSANVIAKGRLQCAVMDKCSFLRLLSSPLYDKFRQRMRLYKIGADADEANLSDID